jgi:cation diffusion facilitator CzcD-associated flavoprotein CzcO
MNDVLIIGAGPAGLGTAAELRRRGIEPVLLDRARLGQTWRDAYDRVHLNTVRWLSHLPGRRIPRHAGRWPSRDDYLAYLEAYASEHELQIREGVDALRIDREDDAWTVATSAGELRARQVVVATGYSAEPWVPDWPGRGGFGGMLLHSGEYRSGAPFAGRHVLVAGAGNSGAEIAVDLAEAGAASVSIAIRTPPHVVVRQVRGVPNQVAALLVRRLPAPLGDAVVAAAARSALGDLARVGLPHPEEGALTRVRRDGAIPIVDSGFVAALERGDVRVVPSVAALTRDGARLEDGSLVRADAIVAATGYRTGLERIAGHLGVVDERGLPIVHGAGTAPSAPGLRFLGFTNPISGNLRELRLDARQVARASARELHADVAAPAPAPGRLCCYPQAA